MSANTEKMSKVTFGLTKLNLEIIEAETSKFDGAKYNYHVWQGIGQKIGWDSLTAALFYFGKQEKECEHPYAYVYRKMDFEKCSKCGKILCEG